MIARFKLVRQAGRGDDAGPRGRGHGDEMMHPEDQKMLEGLAKELADEAGVPVSEVTIHACGRSACEHDVNGPLAEVKNGAGMRTSLSCSKCGSTNFDRAMWELP